MTSFNLTYIDNFIDNFMVDRHTGYKFAAILSSGLANVFLPVILLDILILLLFRHWEHVCRAVKIFFLSVNACQIGRASCRERV